MYNKVGKLFSIQSPVLGVFGTSQRQGKFTLQLLLRKWFIDKGYEVGQLGTEPESILFGMDEIFPFGHESTVNLSGEDSIEYLNLLMHQIDARGKELIIVGCQSGLIPANYFNVHQFTVSQINFLMGTLPDIVILCVNKFDEVDYIKRTIGAIESIVDCKVIALAMSQIVSDSFFRKHMADEEELRKCATKLYDAIGIPVFQIKEDEVDEIGNKIIECLSDK